MDKNGRIIRTCGRCGAPTILHVASAKDPAPIAGGLEPRCEACIGPVDKMLRLCTVFTRRIRRWV